jgi:hypothetical protein
MEIQPVKVQIVHGSWLIVHSFFSIFAMNHDEFHLFQYLK